MVNEGLLGFPTENVIILVVTVIGRGPHPKYIYMYYSTGGSCTPLYTANIKGFVTAHMISIVSPLFLANICTVYIHGNP